MEIQELRPVDRTHRGLHGRRAFEFTELQGLREWLTEHSVSDLQVMCLGMNNRTRLRREILVDWLLEHRLEEVRRARYGEG